MKTKLKAIDPPPVETEEEPYGTPANGVYRQYLGPDHVLSARVGYFIQQHRILREQIEELENALVKAKAKPPKPETKKDQDIEIDRKILKEEVKTLKNMLASTDAEYDKLVKDYNLACELLHKADVDCPEYRRSPDECENCQARHEAP